MAGFRARLDRSRRVADAGTGGANLARRGWRNLKQKKVVGLDRSTGRPDGRPARLASGLPAAPARAAYARTRGPHDPSMPRFSRDMITRADPTRPPAVGPATRLHRSIYPQACICMPDRAAHVPVGIVAVCREVRGGGVAVPGQGIARTSCISLAPSRPIELAPSAGRPAGNIYVPTSIST